MSAARLTAAYAADADFLAAFDNEVRAGGLLVHGATLPNATAMADVVLEVRVGTRAPVDVPAKVAAVMEGVGVAVMFDGKPAELEKLADAVKRGAAHEPAGSQTVAERMRAVNPTQKMQLAPTADREERFALLRDANKVLHLYVLRNPRITLEEVLWAARQTSTSPDALKFISEHQEWGSNGPILAALVRNPHTPTPVALRLLEKLPVAELRAIAKNASARQAIVQAARKRINE